MNKFKLCWVCQAKESNPKWQKTHYCSLDCFEEGISKTELSKKIRKQLKVEKNND